jgi:hypothetical protein
LSSSTVTELLATPFGGIEDLLAATEIPVTDDLLLSTACEVDVPPTDLRCSLLEVAGDARVPAVPVPTVVLRGTPAPVARPTVLGRVVVGVRGDAGVAGLAPVTLVRLLGRVFAPDDTLLSDVGRVLGAAPAAGCWGFMPNSSKMDLRSRGFAADMMKMSN